MTEPTQTQPAPDDAATADATPGGVQTPHAPEADPETFPREYVEQLRREAAEARTKAKRTDDLARDLFAARVAATGRLADAADLPFDEALLTDPDALTAAIDALLAAHPHYAARRPFGDVGQGASDNETGDVDLAGMLRSRA